MINLVPAKCPSCGAALELDDNLKRTECKYCRTTIIVDEAIEKYQIEIKGKVKVSGIKDEEEKLNIIKKYIKIEYFNDAINKLYDFLEEYPFNMEAIKILIEIYIGYYPIDMERKYSLINFKNKDEIVKTTNALVDKLIKLDDENVYSDFINEVREKQRKIKEEIDAKEKEMVRKKKLEQELIEKINKYLEIGLKKRKCNKFIITLLANLKINTNKYGENMCLLNAKEVDFVHDSR